PSLNPRKAIARPGLHPETGRVPCGGGLAPPHTSNPLCLGARQLLRKKRRRSVGVRFRIAGVRDPCCGAASVSEPLEGTFMFDPVFENLRKATELTIQTQRDLFKRWVALWEGGPTLQPVVGEKVQKIQKQWTETVTDALKRQREAMEVQFSAGLKSLE